MQDTAYEELKNDIRKIFGLINQLAEMILDNEINIKVTKTHLNNTLRVMYVMQSKMLIKTTK
jgi:hypothetical protein